jgi:alkylhydroperoxidase family enzyme
MTFLDPAPVTPAAQQLFDEDLAELGFVMNATRLWAYQVDTLNGLFDLLRTNIAAHRLTVRQRGILVTACASAMGDSYCSLAWGTKLAAVAGAATSAAVLRGDDGGLTPAERAMADWARRVVRSPNQTTMDDVCVLRDAGFTDSQIFSFTVFVALRLAFSTINAALGAQPDGAYRTVAPPEVRAAVTYGRPIAGQ